MQREKSNTDKVGKLLAHLQRGGSSAFDSFLAALKDTGQEYVADMLTESTKILSTTPRTRSGNNSRPIPFHTHTFPL